MRVIALQDGFGIENLHVVSRPTPEPGPGEILLEMLAASLNYRDLLMVTGQYNSRQPLPLVPCSDGVGRIVALGAGVENLGVGMRVAPLFAQEWFSGRPTRAVLGSTLGGPRDGVLQERMVVPAAAVVPVPEHLSPVEAATLPCAALTAWSALFTYGNLSPGDHLLLLGTGGVSVFALLFAKLVGASVAITSSSEAKLERARGLGADHGILRHADLHWGRSAARWAGGEGVDQVIEVGGAGTFQESLSALRPGGVLSLIGVLAGGRSELTLLPILMRNLRVQGIFVGHKSGFEKMNRAISTHRLRPVIDQVFPLEESAAALRYLGEGRHFGKVAIQISKDDA
jgi:NADPH:quinone reductase-like Zn-dependent oxidoreductase